MHWSSFPLTPAQREEIRKRAKQTSELKRSVTRTTKKKLLMEKERLEQAQADLEREGYMEAVIEGGFGEKVAKSISEGNYGDAADEIVKDYVEAKAAEKVIILATGNWAKAWQLLKRSLENQQDTQIEEGFAEQDHKAA
ncbi:MAG: hypothetical protein IPL70_06705 [Uliginosibacterium sp.]|nr:hypothetical protein [Uliginosibacterium sp.]